MRLVLVSCCAPCSAGAIKQLAAGQIPGVDDFIVLFFNPNIYPADEYNRRMAEQIRYCDEIGVKHAELEYDHDAWRAAVAGLESAPERGARCSVCFAYRFRRAAEFARAGGYDAIASVLGVSRHKDQAQVDAAAFDAINKFNGHPPSVTAKMQFRDTPRPGGGNQAVSPNLNKSCINEYFSTQVALGSDECPPPLAGGDAQNGHRGVAMLHARRYTNSALAKSRVLKRNMTDAERLLWHYLRGRTDFSFRKQAPIGNYIVDFVCIKHKLIIELDGAQHGDEKHRNHDKTRDEFLNGLGYKILRFWNDEVFNNMDMVLDAIYKNLATPCHITDVTPPAQAVGIKSEIKYLPIKWDEDLRVQINRASDFYRQNYCGCEFSIRK